MIKFLKENAIFVISSILIVGLLTGLSKLEKKTYSDQGNIEQSLLTESAHPAILDISPSITPSTINKEKTPEPTPSPIPSIKIQINSDNEDEIEGD